MRIKRYNSFFWKHQLLQYWPPSHARTKHVKICKVGRASQYRCWRTSSSRSIASVSARNHEAVEASWVPRGAGKLQSFFDFGESCYGVDKENVQTWRDQDHVPEYWKENCFATEETWLNHLFLLWTAYDIFASLDFTCKIFSTWSLSYVRMIEKITEVYQKLDKQAEKLTDEGNSGLIGGFSDESGPQLQNICWNFEWLAVKLIPWLSPSKHSMWAQEGSWVERGDWKCPCFVGAPNISTKLRRIPVEICCCTSTIGTL